MERKTKVEAEAGTQNILITREFELPVGLLFRAYVEPELVAQWMGTKVIKLESRPHGGWQFETCDPQGTVVFRANGVIHEIDPGRKITRTFEMESAGSGPQLEFLEFDALGENRSRLRMQIVYRSSELRDRQLKMPFAYGLSMAHDRLEELANRRIGKLGPGAGQAAD